VLRNHRNIHIRLFVKFSESLGRIYTQTNMSTSNNANACRINFNESREFVFPLDEDLSIFCENVWYAVEDVFGHERRGTHIPQL